MRSPRSVTFSPTGMPTDWTDQGTALPCQQDGFAWNVPEIETSNGRVLVEGHEGVLFIDTSNGAVMISDQAGETSIDTSNGSITLSLHPDAAGPVELGTSNASISLTIGPAFAGSMTLRTSNGSISIHDPTGAIRAQEIGKNRAKLTIGEDGPSSRLWTSNGRITLTVRP